MGFQLPASKANLNDICPSYVAHAMSIANTLASVTGFVSPAIAGELLDTYGNNHTSWGIIWSISGKNFSHSSQSSTGRRRPEELWFESRIKWTVRSHKNRWLNDPWTFMLQNSGIMLLFGGIFYAVFAEGTVQAWAEEKSRDDLEEKTSLKSWR